MTHCNYSAFRFSSVIKSALAPCAVLLGVVLATHGLAAEQERATLSHVTDVGAPLTGLSLTDFSPLVGVRKGSRGQPETVAVVEGQFIRSHTHLIWNHVNPVQLNASSQFRIFVPLTDGAPTTVLDFTEVDAYGSFKTQRFLLTRKPMSSKLLPPAGSSSKLSSVKKVRSFHGGLGIGATQQSYDDRQNPVRSQTALTLKAGISYPLSLTQTGEPQWDLGLSGFATLMAITRSSDFTMRYIGLNLRLGYTVPQIRSPWKLQINGGLYYSTLKVTSNAFGYGGVVGPQLFPTLKRILKSGSSLQVYFKFSPVNSGIQVLSLASREIAAGAAYAWTNSWLITADLADLSLQIGDAAISAKSATLGIGYAF